MVPAPEPIFDAEKMLLVAVICAGLWGICVGCITYVVARRLAMLKPESREYKVQVPLLFKIFLPLAPHVRPLVERDEFAKTLEQTEDRLTQAGLQQVFEPEEFVGLRLIYALTFITAGMFCMLLQTKFMTFFGLFLLGFGVFYPLLWLHGVIKQRHRSIQRALPNVLDLLTLSVEAGRDFLTALREILVHRPRDPLGEELETVFREVQLGKQRRQALSAMADRVGMVDLSSVVETLVQADELGVSIGHILRILGEQMRAKRFATAEKLANESPVKLLFPLFIFIFPAVVIVMLGPILLRSLDGF